MLIKFEAGNEYEGANEAENIQIISRDGDDLKIRTWEGYICTVIPSISTGISTSEYFTYKMRNYFANHKNKGANQ